MVGLKDRIKHKPTQMSGGQQQRVGIARAFVSKPAVVFADEPTGNLDSKTTTDVMRLMVKMAKDDNLTLVIVTHDRDIAEYADRIIQLKDGNVINDYMIEHKTFEENPENPDNSEEIKNNENPENKEAVGELLK